MKQFLLIALLASTFLLGACGRKCGGSWYGDRNLSYLPTTQDEMSLECTEDELLEKTNDEITSP